MKEKNDSTLKTILKGFIIGSSMSVPGVSGGTMAIILGIYDQLIRAVSNFLKDIKGNMMFLIKICIGGGLGILTLSNVIGWLLGKAPVPVSCFFIGAVAGGIPVIAKKIVAPQAGEKSPMSAGSKVMTAVCFLLGLVLVIGIEFIPKNLMHVRTDLSIATLIFWVITGIVVALALVLPGISTSHMLVVLGLYQATLDAIRTMDIVFIACLGIATVVGVFATTKPLEWLMNKYTRATYSGILGFVIGSISAIFKEIIFPGLPKNPSALWMVVTAITSIILFVGGMLFIRFMEKYSGEE